MNSIYLGLFLTTPPVLCDSKTRSTNARGTLQEFISRDCYVTRLWCGLLLVKVSHSQMVPDTSAPHSLLLWISLCAFEIATSFPCISSYLPRDSVLWISENYKLQVTEISFKILNPLKTGTHYSSFEHLDPLIPNSAVTLAGGKSVCMCVFYTLLYLNLSWPPRHCVM